MRHRVAEPSAAEDASPSRRAFLDTSYRRTTYRATLPNGLCEIRIDGIDDYVERTLVDFEEESWAYITAWNPGSRPTPLDENRKRQTELEELLESEGIVFFQGLSRPDDETPGEESLLAFVDEARARDIGEKFEQNAIVAGSLGQPARLIWLR